MASPDWRHLRGRVAGLSRDRDPDDPELVAARRDLAVTRLIDRINDVVTAHGPLSADQRSSILDAVYGGAR